MKEIRLLTAEYIYVNYFHAGIVSIIVVSIGIGYCRRHRTTQRTITEPAIIALPNATRVASEISILIIPQ